MTPPDTDLLIAKSPQSATDRRLIIVSNRLPTSLKLSAGKLEAQPSSGGLASALSGFQSSSGFSWVGWPGCPVPPDRRDEVIEHLSHQRLVPVFLTRAQEDHYYRGICNEVLWPLFHYFTDRVSFTDRSWKRYEEVNRLFAERVLEVAQPGDRVWVHDFHLMLLPALLREREPTLEIGFFLHIPFPSSEIYRVLPTRVELLQGVLGSDYIGFHTFDYTRHFRSTCLRVLGLDSEPDSITYEGRRVGIGTNPIGVDVSGFRETVQSERTTQLLHELKQRFDNRKVILGVERLDYTKGIPLKFQAFERFLERNPNRAKNVTLLQVIVPSRLNHPDYQELKSEIEEFVGRVNGKYGRPGMTPVEYMHRSLSPAQLVALYRFANVALVTPVRDGMNLIAQEFVLCQDDTMSDDAYRGILVLSEFAGAAHYLSRSILVNPWSVEQTADALEEALAMGEKERTERMSVMVEHVADMDCRGWAERFLHQLDKATRRSRSGAQRISNAEEMDLQNRFLDASQRILALDYDGTLREIARSPEEAAPTAEIIELLRRLAQLPNTSVHLVSGRKHETMEEWFGDLPIYLCAEHGYAARSPDDTWQLLHEVDLGWMPMVEEKLRRIAGEVPGAMVERKSCALAWHYRMADLDYGEWRARELLSDLGENLANEPVEVISGHRVIEVRAGGVNKGHYLKRVLENSGDDTFVLCAGDDRTDLDMYQVLQDNAISIHVGRGASGASTYTIESPARLRTVLASLIESVVKTAV